MACTADGGDYNCGYSRCSLGRSCASNAGLFHCACPIAHLSATCSSVEHSRCDADGGWYCAGASECNLARSCASNAGLNYDACPFQKCYGALSNIASEEGTNLQSWTSGYSLMACMRECDGRSDCHSFTFDSGGGECHLKANAHTASSGTGSSERFVTFFETQCSCYGSLGGLAATEGTELSSLPAGTGLQACQDACDANANCRSITYHLENGHCFLKGSSPSCRHILKSA